MSTDDESERTEAPTPRRLARMREEGQLAIGRDLGIVASLLGGLAALRAAAPALEEQMVALVRASVDRLRPVASNGSLHLEPEAFSLFGVAATVMITAGTCGVLAIGAQTRLGHWPKLASPKASRLFQVDKLARLFKRDFLEDLALSSLKVGLISTLLWRSLRAAGEGLAMALVGPASGMLARTLEPLFEGASLVTGAMVGAAVLDFALQRHRFMKKARMSRDEVKREHKDVEGDPLIKAQRRRRHHALKAQGEPARDVPEADAVVVNPTHIAIAIRYRPGKDAAPRVTCKGKGVRAEQMRALARAHGVPIWRDVPLARLLHREVEVGREVPAQTYRAVAAVLAFVYRVRRRAAPRPGASP